MNDDTGIGGPGSRFPTTRRSAVLAAGSEDAAERSRAFDIIVSAYWKPVYKYIRIRWRKSNEDAKDLTQGFFTKVLEKDFLKSYDSSRAKFRTFLRTCLDGFLSNEEKAAGRLKRGGDAVLLSLDYETAEGELKQFEPAGGETPEQYFEKEWIRSFFSDAVQELQRVLDSRGKTIHFQMFEEYNLDEGKRSYQEMAAHYKVSVSDVTNYLALARREFRQIVLDRIREITVTDEEFRREARALLGTES